MTGPAREQAPAGGGGPADLSACTTLRLGGPARRFVTAASRSAIVGEVRAADERGEPLLVLGGGSNLVVADDGFPGTVLRIASRGIDVTGAPADRMARVEVAAGEDWDSVVEWSVAQGLSGFECLSGIPGLAGATPIQNVGAYGQEIAQTLTSVLVYDRAGRDLAELSAADCEFGYRDSVFKRGAAGAAGRPLSAGVPAIAATGRHVVLAVTFTLERSPLSQPVRYGELARALDVPEGGRAPLTQVRAAVLGLRRRKGMVLDSGDPDTRSAGSFFTNPVLSRAGFAALERVVAQVCGPQARVPRFPAGPGQVKVPAAWLIERAGFGKGYRGGPATGSARISAKHTLALVNPGGATTAGLLALAREIRDGVQRLFGVDLAVEPVLVGAGI